mgnify:FL=1
MNNILKNKYFVYGTALVLFLLVMYLFYRRKKGTEAIGEQNSPEPVPAWLKDIKGVPDFLKSPRTPAEAAFVAEWKSAVSTDGLDEPKNKTELEALKKWRDAVVEEHNYYKKNGATTIEALKKVVAAREEYKRLQDIRKGLRNENGEPIDAQGNPIV